MLNFFQIDGVYLLPGPIDVERLKKAIALTLSAYPHAAGRLKRGTDGSWKVSHFSKIVYFYLISSSVPPQQIDCPSHSYDRRPRADR